MDTTYFYWKLKIENTVAKLFLNMWIVSWTVHLSSAQWIHVKLLFIHTKKKRKMQKMQMWAQKCESKYTLYLQYF